MNSNFPDFAYQLFDKIAHENGFNNFSVEIESGSKPGDGFHSDIFQVTIIENESSKKLELLCKIAPSTDNRRKDFFSDKIFKREAILYQIFLPMLAKFQEEKQLPTIDQFRSYPKCYGAIIDDEKQQYMIVLENLRPLEFKMWDKTKPTTIENARITMRELGKFHGLSIALKDQKQTEFKEFKQLKNFIPEFLKSKNFLHLFENSYIRAIDSLKNEDHKGILTRIKDNLLQFMEYCFDEKASEHIGVFCHGDLWNNNLLYHFNEENIAEEIRFLDWQYCHFGSPAIDIIYNLLPSTDKALRDKEYDNLIKLYYDSLSKTVKLLGSDPDKLFTYDDLLSELKRCGVYALLFAPMVLQLSLANSCQIPNLNEMCDKVAEGDGKMDLITGLTTKGQSEHDRRLNEVFEDVIKLGYYQMHQHSHSIQL